MGYFTAIFRVRLRLGFAEVLGVAVVAVLAVLVYHFSPVVFWTTVIGASAANLAGWTAGWFVTHVWGLPSDGSDPCADEGV